jgi:hypothetical protein
VTKDYFFVAVSPTVFSQEIGRGDEYIRRVMSRFRDQCPLIIHAL